MVKTKKCSTCGQLKAFTEFYSASRLAGTMKYPYCKPCGNLMARNHRERKKLQDKGEVVPVHLEGEMWTAEMLLNAWKAEVRGEQETRVCVTCKKPKAEPYFGVYEWNSEGRGHRVCRLCQRIKNNKREGDLK
jgi:hypothetical protein